MKDENIKVFSWSPLDGYSDELINSEQITNLGKKYNKSQAQIILKWHIQLNYIPIPKSFNNSHIKENFNISDFSLENSEIEQISFLIKKKLIDHSSKEYEELKNDLLSRPLRDNYEELVKEKVKITRVLPNYAKIEKLSDEIIK